MEGQRTSGGKENPEEGERKEAGGKERKEEIAIALFSKHSYN